MSTIKICSICSQILDANVFAKKKAMCKQCYNKLYREKNHQKRLEIKKQKELETKTQVIKEYEALVEENTILKEKLVQLEKQINVTKMVEEGEYNKLISEHEKLIDEHKKLKECIELMQMTLRRYSNIV